MAKKSEYKSERLKKLESELADLNQWLDLGLVPKKEVKKHKEEIRNIEKKIEDEKIKLKLLKETGEIEEFAVKKKIAKAYSEPQTLPDVEEEKESEETQTALDAEETITDKKYKDEATVIEELEEDPFSDKNRWKRGILENPDENEW